MGNIGTIFAQGGPTMYLIAMLFVPMLAFCVLHLVLVRGWTLAIAIVLLIAPASLGIFGTLHGRRTTDINLAHLEASTGSKLKAAGYQRASYPIKFGLGVTVIGVIPLLIGEMRRHRNR